MDMGITQRVLESDGDVRLKKIDIDSVLKTLHKTIVGMKVAPLEMGYKKNEDESIDILYRNCYFFDACQLALDEGLLKRQDGRQVWYLCSRMPLSQNWYGLRVGLYYLQI